MKPSAKIDVVCFGEVLWDVLPTGALPGGAPMNVAYHLRKLGIDSALISKIGDDNYGHDLVQMLKKEGIKLYCQTDAEQPTGLVNATEGENHEMTYDIAFPAAWDYIEWKPEYEKLVSEASYLVYGTLSNRYHITRETLHRLVPCANKNVFDVNLRTPHYQQPGVEVLLKETDILKMNLAELILITDWFSRGGSVEDRMKFLRHRFGIETIIVTRGGEGAILLAEEKLTDHPGYSIEVKDTIGSGDAFLAGFLAQTIRGADAAEALDFAAAIGAFVATKSGGTPSYVSEDVQRFKNAKK